MRQMFSKGQLEKLIKENSGIPVIDATSLEISESSGGQFTENIHELITEIRKFVSNKIYFILKLHMYINENNYYTMECSPTITNNENFDTYKIMFTYTDSNDTPLMCVLLVSKNEDYIGADIYNL